MPATITSPIAFNGSAKDAPLIAEELSAALSTNGFASVQSIASPAEVAQIRAILSGLLAKKVGAKEGALFDTLSSTPDEQVKRSIQMTNPSEYAPQLARTDFVKNATALARHLIAPDCVLMVDLALLKPAQIGKGTPWHQDEASRDPGFNYKELTFWMALQDVGTDDGCMVFLPGSQDLKVLEHQPVNNDPRAHAFECIEQFSKEQGVACPLPAGGCSIHGPRTLHCTGNNVSGIDRYAYILIFGVPPTPVNEPRSFPWLDQRKNAHRQAKRAWLLRGGIFVLLKRKWQRGELRGMAMVRYSLARGIKVLRGK